MGIYAMVAFALLVQLAFGYLYARRMVRNSKLLELPGVRESSLISVPVTVGQIAPTILLPTGWREWDSAKLQAVLSHEDAHIRRADWAIGVMARINCCVFWFHPLAWWLKRELALLAEYACDDSVMAQMGDRRQYARALLEIACAMKSAQGRFMRNAVSMAKGTNVEKRMQQILDDTRTIPVAFSRRGWVTLLVCSLPVGYFASVVQLAPAQTRTVISVPDRAATDQPVQVAQARPAAPQQILAQAAPAPEANPTQKRPDEVVFIISDEERIAFKSLTSDEERRKFIAEARLRQILETPYQKWLNEEVVYLISEDERRAFMRFTTDDERQQFIEQFWLRRDPTPGTPENEFKEEHYRRIAWANDNFSAAIPGWQTDRGLIYIKYGPPGAVKSVAATPTYPIENWYYRYVEALGTPGEFQFVDPTMTGRYHLTKDPTEKNR